MLPELDSKEIKNSLRATVEHLILTKMERYDKFGRTNERLWVKWKGGRENRGEKMSISKELNVAHQDGIVSLISLNAATEHAEDPDEILEKDGEVEDDTEEGYKDPDDSQES